jgi:hypothetical protein
MDKMKKAVTKGIFLFCLFTVVSKTLLGQQNVPTKVDSLHKSWYIVTSNALGTLLIRDFATSPLFYVGPSIRLAPGGLMLSQKADMQWSIDLSAASVIAKAPKSNFAQTLTGALVLSGEVYAHYLHHIDIPVNSRFEAKIGGAAMFSSNIRYNSSLGNNGIGVDNLANLMFAAKFTKDISRKQERIINLYIFKPRLKPVKRDLSLQVNAGILNFNHRPGYAYTYESEINGTETTPVKWLFDNYSWSMNGWRLHTRLNLTRYLPNGNARQWSYVWDAAHAPEKHEAFQMATHRIQYSLFFNFK